MAITMARYFDRQKITLHCETVTPMFLGNAGQEAEWRGAPFKGLIRYWWRVTQHQQKDEKSLLEAESKLFGSAGGKDEANAGKSLISIRAVCSNAPPSKAQLPELSKIEHPECEKQHGSIDPLLYLANMGIMGPGGKVKHSYFPPEANFDLVIEYPGEQKADVMAVLSLIRAFGTLGARCRNGWGSVRVKDDTPIKAEAIGLLARCTREDWTTGFTKEYPNCLGKDKKGCLLWRTKILPTWSNAMRQLAEAYVSIRTKSVGDIPKLDANGRDYPGERHLLGFPLTSHPAQKSRNWGNNGRHGSSLRFVVRRKTDGFQGFVLHLPHRFSDRMEFMPATQQVDVWGKVHKKLDHLLQRAGYEECL